MSSCRRSNRDNPREEVIIACEHGRRKLVCFRNPCCIVPYVGCVRTTNKQIAVSSLWGFPGRNVPVCIRMSHSLSHSGQRLCPRLDTFSFVLPGTPSYAPGRSASTPVSAVTQLLRTSISRALSFRRPSFSREKVELR